MLLRGGLVRRLLLRVARPRPGSEAGLRRAGRLAVDGDLWRTAGRLFAVAQQAQPNHQAQGEAAEGGDAGAPD